MISLSFLAILVGIGLHDLLDLIELNSVEVLLEGGHVFDEVLQLGIASHGKVLDHFVEVNHIVVDVFQSPSQNEADVGHVDGDLHLRGVHLLLSPLEEDVLFGCLRGASRSLLQGGTLRDSLHSLGMAVIIFF